MTGGFASVVVVGGGIFGVTAALALARRGHAVTLVAPGGAPDPLASSNDPSRLVRADYGTDGLYRAWMLEAMEGWHAWNAVWGADYFHRDGLLVLASGSMRPGGFEYECFDGWTSAATPQAIGRPPLQRIDFNYLAAHFPAWSWGPDVDGYFNSVAGWVQAGSVLKRLWEDLTRAGIRVVGEHAVSLTSAGDRITGVTTQGFQAIEADVTLVAAGAWTTRLVPQLADCLGVTGHPLLYFQLPPERVAAYQPPQFAPWTADIAQTGWYGFPALPDGRLKLGNHGPGRTLDPDAPREVLAQDVEMARAFLAAHLPEVASLPLAGSRLCLYSDSPDGDFWIDHDPDHPGLVVAAGDSGHGFKFAPVLGNLIADVVEGRPNPYAQRFRWRSAAADGRHEEARWMGDSGG